MQFYFRADCVSAHDETRKTSSTTVQFISKIYVSSSLIYGISTFLGWCRRAGIFAACANVTFAIFKLKARGMK